MNKLSPTILYVCDYSRLHHLLVSIISWRRFMTLPVHIVDIGLTDIGRMAVQAVAENNVVFINPGITPEIPEYIQTRQQVFAFAQKTLVGLLSEGDPLIFLDSDIFVTHKTFLERLISVRADELMASQSAWDSNFSWTYTSSSLDYLRDATSDNQITLNSPICNSGVWSMRSLSASKVAPIWHNMFRTALDSWNLRETLNIGTQIGDQEFLLPACKAIGINWCQLPGAYNMQVHEKRMPWSMGVDGYPLGGHPMEAPEPIRAVHYGCLPDGSLALEEDMITVPAIRNWLIGQYSTCWKLLQEKLGNAIPISKEME